MIKRIIGKIEHVNGPVVMATDITDAIIYELVKVGSENLVGEIIKIEGSRAVIQVYEDTTGLKPGTPVYGDKLPLSIELGPGLIGTIYDGIQRPLNAIRATSGVFIQRGADVPSLDRTRLWHFIPSAVEGQALSPGAVLGTVAENEQITIKIMVPPDIKGTLRSIEKEGYYPVDKSVAVIGTDKGEKSISLMQRWPIRIPRPVASRLLPEIPLITGQRVIDTLFPVAKGGTVAIPGGFGTGKTMTQQALAKWCDAQVIVYIGCGERGNEMTDVLTEFPEIIDPRSGRSLMERTVLIANTSNMPVSAREASIYTGVTIAEFFRDQGYHVAVMADSTSRWAEALRELSGRMEEMPAEEGFPAYLPTKIAEFYERAGYMKTLSGEDGSVTIIGAVSPPGGDFSEPVTQHTKRFIRCFWALDRNLANARHYPAISWLESYSEYLDEITAWAGQNIGPDWHSDRSQIMDLLQREVKLQQVVKLVGPDALPDSQRFILDVCTMFKNAFLQQNAFDKIDMYSTIEKQVKMLHIIVQYYLRGAEAIKKGATLVKLRKMKVYQDIVKMKYSVPNDNLAELDKIEARLERSITQLDMIYSK